MAGLQAQELGSASIFQHQSQHLAVCSLLGLQHQAKAPWLHRPLSSANPRVGLGGRLRNHSVVGSLLYQKVVGGL
eukprot:1155342-Pelagomonas_calceolata.AAC.3